MPGVSDIVTERGELRVHEVKQLQLISVEFKLVLEVGDM